jgi:hypothetical protein
MGSYAMTRKRLSEVMCVFVHKHRETKLGEVDVLYQVAILFWKTMTEWNRLVRLFHRKRGNTGGHRQGQGKLITKCRDLVAAPGLWEPPNEEVRKWMTGHGIRCFYSRA